MESDDDDNGHTGVIRAVDIRRFGAMRAFDNQLVCNAMRGKSNKHMMSRMDYARLICESIRDDLPEAVEKKKMEAESEKNKRKKLESEDVEFESEKNKRKKLESAEGGEFESENKKMKKKMEPLIYYSQAQYDNRFTPSLTPDDDPKYDAMFQAFVDSFKGLQEIHDELGPEAVEAESKARLYRYEAEAKAVSDPQEAEKFAAKAREAEAMLQYYRDEAKAREEAKALIDPEETKLKALNEAAEAAAKALNEAEEAAEAAAKALNEAKQAAEAAAKALREAQEGAAKALNETQEAAAKALSEAAAKALKEAQEGAAKAPNEAQEAPAKAPYETRGYVTRSMSRKAAPKVLNEFHVATVKALNEGPRGPS